jgi:hypothetical protein
MSSDKTSTSDRTTSGSADMSKAERGLNRIDDLLAAKSAQTNNEGQSAELDQANATETLEPEDAHPGSTDTPADGHTEATVPEHSQVKSAPTEAPTRHEPHKPKYGRMFEAGLIAVPLIFSAVSSEAAQIEAQQPVVSDTPTSSHVVETPVKESQPDSTKASSGEIPPDVALLADAHDMEQRRRIEEDAAGQNRDPGIAAGNGDPPEPASKPVSS